MATRTTTELIAGAPKGFFISRMASKEVPFGEGDAQVIFVVQGLSSDKMTYANAQAANDEGRIDPGILMWWTVKLGVTGIKNIIDDTGKKADAIFDTIFIFSKANVVSALSDETMKKIPYHVLTGLYPVIQAMTFMSPEEVEKLDFFTPAPEVSNATTTPKGRSRKTSKEKLEILEEVSDEQKQS